MIMVLSAFILLNIYFSTRPLVALVKWVKIVEMALLAFLISQIKIKKSGALLQSLAASLIFFGLIGLVQFWRQATIGGPLYFLGERTFDKLTPGIALFYFQGQSFLRPYSTFSHPNSMAGYFAAVAVLLPFFKSFKKGERWLRKTALFIAGVILVLTFSQGAWLSLLIAFLFWSLINYRKKLTPLIVNTIFFVSVLISLMSPLLLDVQSGKFAAKEEVSSRLVLAKAAGLMIAERPFFGVGLNNFLVRLPEKGLNVYTTWKLQPVHNLFLLVFVEAGLVGLFLFLFLFWRALQRTIKTKNTPLLISLIIIILTGLFDHFWLTLQQNLLLLAIVLGLVFNHSSRKIFST